ncbi:MAG TPA: NUDIX domain-containing protein [Stellaceae bacterium]|nr:NUDIX domain-containing protein [Stellaceae bacterium]
MTPVPAATLLLLRDSAEGIEVLLTTRHKAAGFAAGAAVFPGGKLDSDDRARARTDRAGDPFRIAAIRETFEESGILLARRDADGAMLSGAQLVELVAQQASSPEFSGFIAGTKLTLATDLLVPFAHWITPVDQPKRYDTRFFLAPAPPGQTARHDGHEAVEVHWLTAEGAIAAARAGRIKLVMATRLNLLKLGRSKTVADALDAARRSEIVTVEPELVQTDRGPAFRIPAAADYGMTEMLVSGYSRA